MIERITSSANRNLKLLRGVSSGKFRAKNGVYSVEGLRAAEEAVRYARRYVRCVILSEFFYESNKSFAKELDKNGFSVYTVGDRLFCQASETVSPQGIAVLMNIPDRIAADFDGMSRVLLLDGISEPGNMGTIIRTSEAAGVDTVCLMKGCADIYNPKVVRSTMGSIFRTRFTEADSADVITTLKAAGFIVVASDLNASIPLCDFKTEPGAKVALVIGSEACGVSKDVLSASDVRVRIPMRGAVESLNAAVAAGILMYNIFK